MTHDIRKTTKAARLELSRRNQERIFCVFPRKDYRTSHGTKVKRPTRSLVAYSRPCSGGEGIEVLVRYDRAWWTVRAVAVQLTCLGEEPLRHSDGRVARASLFFYAQDIVTVKSKPGKLAPWK